jgi:hypothetical protein
MTLTILDPRTGHRVTVSIPDEPAPRPVSSAKAR